MCGEHVKLAARRPHASFDTLGARHAQAEAGLSYFRQDGLRWTKVGRTGPEKPAPSKPLALPPRGKLCRAGGLRDDRSPRTFHTLVLSCWTEGLRVSPASAAASRRDVQTHVEDRSGCLHLSHVTCHSRGC